MGACAGCRKKLVSTTPLCTATSEHFDTEPSLRTQSKSPLSESSRKTRISTKRRDLTISSFLVPGAVVTNRPKMREDYERLVKALTQHSVLSELTEDAIDVVIDRMKHFFLSSGTTICRQNEVATHFFVVASGRVELRRDGEPVSTLSPGDSFGELALIYMTKRDATAVALEDTGLWGVDRGKFREAVESVNIRNYHESQTFLNTVPIFQVLSKAQKDALLTTLTIQKFPAGAVIVREGERGDQFFIIREGSVVCTVQSREQRRLGKGEFFGEQALLYNTERTATVTAIGAVKTYTISGQRLTQVLGRSLQQLIYRNTLRIAFDRQSPLNLLAYEQKEDLLDKVQVDRFAADSTDIRLSRKGLYVLLKGTLVRADGRAVQVTEAWGDFDASSPLADDKAFSSRSGCDVAFISNETLESAIGGRLSAICSINETMALLKKVSIFNGFSRQRLSQIMASLRTTSFCDKAVIIQQGEPVYRLLLLKSGQVEVRKDGELLENHNGCFWERSLLSAKISPVTIISSGQSSFLELQREEFNRICDERLREAVSSRLKRLHSNVEISTLRPVKLLSRNDFSFTALVVDPKTRCLYALKTICKRRTFAFSITALVQQETAIMQRLSHSLLVTLLKTHQDAGRLFLLSEFVQSDSFPNVIKSLGLLKDAEVKFYAAGLVLALEHLHEKGIVYRDLKLENVRIDAQGYPRLIKFRSSKVLTEDRTFTIVGTPHYTAPEVLTGKGYGVAVDYWSLGILLYELTFGSVPFGEEESDPYVVYSKVLHAPLSFPNMRSVSAPLQSLMESLLARNPSIRSLGGFEKVKSSRFFHLFDWEKVVLQTAKVPLTPNCPSLDAEVGAALSAGSHSISEMIAEIMGADEPLMPE